MLLELKIFKRKKDFRKLSFAWWSNLLREEQLDIEKDYFDNLDKGETTDIDIECMYLHYNENKK
jgi:hypothetical protein